MGIQKPANNGMNAPVEAPVMGVPSASSTNTPDVVTSSGPADTVGHILAPSAH